MNNLHNLFDYYKFESIYMFTFRDLRALLQHELIKRENT